MQELIYYNNLYDLYSDLLTKKEQMTFEDYYQENLSLSEIAEYNQISRSAVQKTLKNVLDKLKYYEEKLCIYTKEQKLKDALLLDDIEKIKSIINETLS